MKHKITTALFLGALSFSSNAFDLSDISVGASTGSLKYDSGMASENAEDKESAFSFFGQYQLQESIKVELAMNSFGDYTQDTHSTSFSSVTASMIAETTIANGFKPYAKLGLGLMNMTQTIDFLDTEIENKSTGDHLLAGFGVAYTNEHFSNVMITLSYDYYYFKTSKLLGSEDSSNSLSGVSLGIIYHFK
jgi:opacity protein-like surface antigen